jgi:hypothetical protein
MNRFLFLIKTLLTLAAFIGVQQLIELQTKGFCLQKIFATDLPARPEWETPPLSSKEHQKIDALLSQRYRLIGSGSECFAFLSEDGKTVIKLFKLDIMRPVFLHRGLFEQDHSAHAGTLSTFSPPSFRPLARLLGMREFRLKRTFSSIKMSFDSLKEETGLIYLHLNPSTEWQKTLTLIDGSGICHTIDIDTTLFFLQKGAFPLENHLEQHIAEGRIKEAQQCLDSYLELILSRCQKGFSDRDVFIKNYGVVENRVIEIDSGSFIPHPPMSTPSNQAQELFFATRELSHWLQKRNPLLFQYLEQHVESLIESTAFTPSSTGRRT